VDKVALAFYPRSGWLSNMYTWVGDYDESVALAALNRLYAIAHQLFTRGVTSDPDRIHVIDAVPHDCGFCPFYRPDMDPQSPATGNGCPGS
jgi:hypothetical protein